MELRKELPCEKEYLTVMLGCVLGAHERAMAVSAYGILEGAIRICQSERPDFSSCLYVAIDSLKKNKQPGHSLFVNHKHFFPVLVTIREDVMCNFWPVNIEGIQGPK